MLSNMKLAGIAPDAASFHCVIEALLEAENTGGAVEVCKEGHCDGVMKHYTPPTASTHAAETLIRNPTKPDSGVVDLTGCPTARVAAVVCVAWIESLVQQYRDHGELSIDEHSKIHIIMGDRGQGEGEDGCCEGGEGAYRSIDSNLSNSEYVCRGVVDLLSSGQGPFSALSSVLPISPLPKTSRKYTT